VSAEIAVHPLRKTDIVDMIDVIHLSAENRVLIPLKSCIFSGIVRDKLQVLVYGPCLCVPAVKDLGQG
jgi:hypothetical protein